MSSSSTLPVNFDGSPDEAVGLPKSAAFLMAMGNVDSAIRNNEATYNNPASTKGQLRAIERTVKAKIMEAYDIHRDLFREDVEAYVAAAEKCHVQSEAMHDNRAKRIDMLAKAMNIPMANMTSDGQLFRYDVIPMRLQIQYWILAILFVVGSELAIFHPLALMPSWPLVLAVVTVATLPKKLHEALSTQRCFYWYSIYSLSVLVGLFLEPAMHVLATEACTDRQLLLLRWCMAYIISEAEWHWHVHEATEHPIGRDLLPTMQLGWGKSLSVPQAQAKFCLLKFFLKLLSRTVLVTLVGIPPIILLRTIGDVPGKPIDWIPFHGSALYPPTWVGIIPQYLVLTRPVKHLMAWLTDRIFDIGLSLWIRARRWYLYRDAGVP